MKTLIYVVIAVLIIGGGWYLYTNKNSASMNTNNSTGSVSSDWVGSYGYHYQVPNAQDGTTNYEMTIAAATAGDYAITFTDSSMLQTSYKLTGKEVTPGKIDAYFDSPITNNLNENVYKKGKLIFSLAQKAGSSGSEVNVTWATDPKLGAEGVDFTFKKK